MTSQLEQYLEIIARKEANLNQAVVDCGLEFGPDRSQEKQEIQQQLQSYEVNECNNHHSLHLNRLSPACIHCNTGTGATTFILGLACNRECYFCTNRNQYNYEELCEKFNNVVAEFEAFAEVCEQVRSVALTGGEPLLYPDECLQFYSDVKKYDPSIHTRLYTNGDLLTTELVKELAPFLDEIRIGFKTDADGNFDLILAEKHLRQCKEHISQVTVEVPVPPDGYEQMIALLSICNDVQIFSVNLLEFLFPWQSPEKYIEAGYRIKHKPYKIIYNYSYAGGLPIDGSEAMALRCLLYAARNNFQIGVHYCSLENKLSSQVYQQNSGVKPTPTELHSPNDHYFKSLRFFGDISEKVRGILEENQVLRFLWDEQGQYLEVHPHEISFLREEGIADVALLTYALVEKGEEGSYMREVHYEVINPAIFDTSTL